MLFSAHTILMKQFIVVGQVTLTGCAIVLFDNTINSVIYKGLTSHHTSHLTVHLLFGIYIRLSPAG